MTTMATAHDNQQTTDKRTVAVIGAGVSGLTSAYILATQCNVTIYEAEPRLGGHAHTHDVVDPSGKLLAVDTGFIVHNDRTYPQLRRLFAELDVQTRQTEMSMSIRDVPSDTEFAGGRGVSGVFAQKRRMLDPRFLLMLAEVKRFHLLAKKFLGKTDDRDETTYGQFLRTHRFSKRFMRLYAIPVVSCVWSMGAAAALDYPARYLFRFLSNHGMLAVKGSPQWFTVVGGSRAYVDAIAARLPHVRSGHSVVQVLREDDGVAVQDNSGTWVHYDGVVIATHADQALELLADASVEEKEVLGAFEYSRSA